MIISDLARNAEQVLREALVEPRPLTLILIFGGGLMTSLGPCSLSLLPVTVAYLAGFSEGQPPWKRSFAFCSGIVSALVLLGALSGLVGRIYGQVPGGLSAVVALLAVVMGLNLLGVIKFSLPLGPDPESWRRRVPAPLAPVATGLAFGLAASPCTTPVLAVLLGWIATSGRPLLGIVFLTCFGSGQVLPLLIVGNTAAVLPRLLALRPVARWIPAISGIILVVTGSLTLLAYWL
ncbi:cytochrome c biogenesis protein CcdA [cyanobiont of Ornithocercus magnificus]|nr:cytochrome c biogenesis protein CcdA [cyanobiont of Ornithocercus magnificus]